MKGGWWSGKCMGVGVRQIWKIPDFLILGKMLSLTEIFAHVSKMGRF